MPRLNDLRILRLSGEKNIGPVIKAVGHSTNLTELQLDSCKVDEETVSIISKLPNLTKLSLNNTPLTDKDLAVLSKCDKLILLAIIKFPVSLETVKILRSFKSLQSLQVYSEPSSNAVPGPQLVELRRRLPELTIN